MDGVLCGECKDWIDIHRGKDGRKVGTCQKTGKKHYRIHKCDSPQKLTEQDKFSLDAFVRNQNISKEEVTTMYLMRSSGSSYGAIAQAVGRNSGYVYTTLLQLKERGIVMNTDD